MNREEIKKAAGKDIGCLIFLQEIWDLCRIIKIG
nr:MAG TPA: hypothetical protein [Caudoviricetes sp.]